MDPAAGIVTIMLIYCVLTLFLYCYVGKLATESYQGISDALFEANWADLPVEFQKYFLIMIGNSQKPLYYHGFGVIILNLDTFTTVR